MAILHVVPANDQTTHDLEKAGTCACQPTIVDEGKDSNGWVCQTVIHRFSGVTEDEQPMRVKKVTLDAKTGALLTVEAPSSQQFYGAQVRSRR